MVKIQREREMGFPGGTVVKNLPFKAGDGREAGRIPESGRSPEKGMATHSSILAWKISWTEDPDSLQSRGSQRVRHDLATDISTSARTNPAQL